MRITLLPLVLLAGSALANQTVWKWVDEKGVTHYSDRAVPGATRMDLGGGGKSKSSDEDSSSARFTANPSEENDAAEAGPAYADFAIWQPSDGETVVNTGGAVTVNVRLEPALRANHSIFLYMDGRLIEGAPGNSLTFELGQVPRGTHTLIAVVNDQTGKRLQETQTVTFMVRQESISQPPVGPSLRPTPKPRSTGANKMPASQPTYVALNGDMAPKIDPVTNRPVDAQQDKP